MNPFFSNSTALINTTNTPAARQREVENALLVQTLCGQVPNLAVQNQLQRYVAGELSREQAFASLYAGLQGS
ncbi:MAG: antitoxin VbhA family protein [Janthinobacterium lividum]